MKVDVVSSVEAGRASSGGDDIDFPAHGKSLVLGVLFIFFDDISSSSSFEATDGISAKLGAPPHPNTESVLSLDDGSRLGQ